MFETVTKFGTRIETLSLFDDRDGMFDGSVSVAMNRQLMSISMEIDHSFLYAIGRKVARLKVVMRDVRIVIIRLLTACGVTLNRSVQNLFSQTFSSLLSTSFLFGCLMEEVDEELSDQTILYPAQRRNWGELLGKGT